MSTKRIKAESFANRISFEIAVDRCSFLEAEVRRLEAEQALAVLKAQKTNADELATAAIELKSTVALCEKYAEDHRAELLPDENKSKSVQTAHSVYGFRTGMPVLKLFSKNTWEKVTDRLRALGKMKFVRVSYETNKQALLTAQTSEDLAALGVKVVQAEDFYIEPKTDGAETVKAGGAS